MLKQTQQSEAALIAVIRQATAELNAVGTTELDAALAELEAAKQAALLRLKGAASVAHLTIDVLNDETDGVVEQLRSMLFAAPEPTEGRAGPQAEAQPSGEDEAPEQHQAEQVVSVAANSPVAEPSGENAVNNLVERTAIFVEALQEQAGEGATREEVEAGLDALGLEAWHKRDLTALARRLSRDLSGKPGKAELVRLVRHSVLDVQSLCAFNN